MNIAIAVKERISRNSCFLRWHCARGPRATTLPKGHSRSQELQDGTSLTQILLKSDT